MSFNNCEFHNNSFSDENSKYKRIPPEHMIKKVRKLFNMGKFAVIKYDPITDKWTIVTSPRERNIAPLPKDLRP